MYLDTKMDKCPQVKDSCRIFFNAKRDPRVTTFAEKLISSGHIKFCDLTKIMNDHLAYM